MTKHHPADPEPGTTAGLQLESISISVPDGDLSRTILDGAGLDVRPGEVVGVTGISGSGKSTLLAIAGLLRRPEQGRVSIAGTDATTLRERERTALRGREIGIIYQSANLLPSLTAREQLLLVGHINRLANAEAARRADELLDAVDLSRLAHQLPVHMSGGERQRVGIARSLMTDPSVLLADEPTASLDPDLADQITELLTTQARSRGIAALIVTHDDAPLRHVDRRLHLADGHLSAVPVTVA